MLIHSDKALNFKCRFVDKYIYFYDYPVVHYILLELAQQTKFKFVFCTARKRRERLSASPFYFGPSFASMYSQVQKNSPQQRQLNLTYKITVFESNIHYKTLTLLA